MARRHIVLRCISEIRMQLEVTMFGERNGAQVGVGTRRSAATDGPQSLSDKTRASLGAPDTLYFKIEPYRHAVKHKLTNARFN